MQSGHLIKHNQPTFNAESTLSQNEKVEALIKQAILEKDITLLIDVCDFYKKSSQPMHSIIVKCHIIYMAIKLDFNIQKELEEWENQLSKNSDLNFNAYLLSHYMPKDEQDLIKLGKAYRALKDLVSVFADYNNDENFKKQLQKRCNCFHTDADFLTCIEAYDSVRKSILDNRISNDTILDDNEIKVLKKYISDYLWLIDETPEKKTKYYKELLTIKYALYKILVSYYIKINKSKYYDLCLAISEFDATEQNQFFYKACLLLSYCEIKWQNEDNFPDKNVLQNRQLMCKAAISNLKEALISIKDTEFAEKILKVLVRCITLYVNYELLLNDNSIIDKLSFYNDYKNESEHCDNLSLNSSIIFSCKFISYTNLNYIEETKKMISNLFNCKTKNKQIQNKIKSIKECMEKYSIFHSKLLTIESEYEVFTSEVKTVKEYRKVALKINNFLKELGNNSDMKQFKDFMGRALFINQQIKVHLALLTYNKDDIESAKKSLSEYNKHNVVSIDLTTYCKYQLLGIKFYEIIPKLEVIKKSFVQSSTESDIRNYLTGYLLDTIHIFIPQFNNTVLNYDNKSISVNFAVLESIINEFYKKFDTNIDLFLITEAMIELFQDIGLIENYNDLYTIFIKQQLENIKNCLDKDDTLNKKEKAYLYKFYIDRYTSITHNDNEEDPSYCINIYLKLYELLKTNESASANSLINNHIDEAINIFPNEIKFFEIKLSLLKYYNCPVVSDDNEELTDVPILPEKMDPDIISKSNNYKKLEKQREIAYKNLKDKQEILINCQKKYNEEKENFVKLCQEINNIFESIIAIDIEHITSKDALIIKAFNEKNKNLSKLKQAFQITTEKLQNERKEFDETKKVYETADKKLSVLIKVKAVEARKEAVTKTKKEEAIAKKNLEQAKKNETTAKKKAEQAKKDGETITQAVEKARQQEVAARKEIEKAQEKETKAKIEAETIARNEAEKEVAAAKAGNEAANTREKAEKAEKKIAEAREKEDKAKIEVDKAREQEVKAKIKVDKAREEKEKVEIELVEAREEKEKAEIELAEAREEEEKAETELAKTRGEEAKAREEAEKLEILLNGEGSKINEQDLANIYKLHKELESKGIKLKITGSFAARLFIYFYNPTQKEIAKLFSVKDIDLVIPYYKNYLNSIRNYEDYDLNSIKGIISVNGYDLKKEDNAIETPDFLNVKRTKLQDNDGIEFDLSVEKSPLNSVDKFMPFHFLHLEMIEKDEIKDHDKTISIGDYHFKLCIKEGLEKEIEKACKFAEFMILKPQDNFRHYSYSVFKYLAKLSNCAPNNLIESVIKQHFSPKGKDDPIIVYYINKSQRKVGLFYEEMKRFAIGILEGKGELVRPFILNFYFTLLLNEVDFRRNRAKTPGYSFIPPAVDQLRQFASECTDLFINNNNILENARNPNYSFYNWKRNINDIVFKKFDEYEQGCKNQLDKDQLARSQSYQKYQPHHFIEPHQEYQLHQQEYQQHYNPSQQGYQVYQQQEYQPYKQQQQQFISSQTEYQTFQHQEYQQQHYIPPQQGYQQQPYIPSQQEYQQQPYTLPQQEFPKFLYQQQQGLQQFLLQTQHSYLNSLASHQQRVYQQQPVHLHQQLPEPLPPPRRVVQPQEYQGHLLQPRGQYLQPQGHYLFQQQRQGYQPNDRQQSQINPMMPRQQLVTNPYPYPSSLFKRVVQTGNEQKITQEGLQDPNAFPNRIPKRHDGK